MPILSDIDFVQYQFLLYGLALVGMMLLRPEGLFPNRRRAAELHTINEPGGADVEGPDPPVRLQARGAMSRRPSQRPARTTSRPRQWHCVRLRHERGQSEIVLHARAVTKRFGGLLAVNNAELIIPKGSIISLIGPNGAGKTTFFNMVAGILDPTSGVVEFRGRRMIARPERTWLEPLLWLGPARSCCAGRSRLAGHRPRQPRTRVLLVTIALASDRHQPTDGHHPAALVRPPCARIGVFKSARPNDMVQAGIGRTFQNIRLFQNMTVIENVLVGMHVKLRSQLVDAIISSRRQAEEERAAEIVPASCSPWSGSAGATR